MADAADARLERVRDAIVIRRKRIAEETRLREEAEKKRIAEETRLREEEKKRTAEETRLREEEKKRKAEETRRWKEETKRVTQEMLEIGVTTWLERDKERREESSWRESGGDGAWEQEKERRKLAKRERQKRYHQEVKQEMINWRCDQDTIEYTLERMQKKQKKPSC